jgi:hypothetical protein
MASTAPSTSIQIDSFVGEPLNVRDTSELNECEALNPKMRRIIPPTDNANPIAVFMSYFS